MFIGFWAFRQLEECIVCFCAAILSCQRVISDGVFLFDHDCSAGLHVAAVRVWPVTWALCGRCGGEAGPQGFVRPPWGCGSSTGFRVAAVGAWLIP